MRMKVIPPQFAGGASGQPSSGLPHVNALHPSVPVHAIGRALSRFYDDLLAEGVPDHLASLVRQVERGRAGSGAERGTARRTALVVEDDPDQRALAETLLEETTLAVEGCASAEEALERLERGASNVAFVFADVHLAGTLDGVALARRVALRWPQVRVVVTSGAHDVRSGDLPQGATFLPKPWRALSLLMEADRAEG
jgi:CheY-like chemotaxis protein